MNQRQKQFVRALAEYLAGSSARKSIELQMGKESAKEWATLRSATPLSGWVDVPEAEIVLTKFLEPKEKQ
jgi:hypothetical protein